MDQQSPHDSQGRLCPSVSFRVFYLSNGGADCLHRAHIVKVPPISTFLDGITARRGRDYGSLLMTLRLVVFSGDL